MPKTDSPKKRGRPQEAASKDNTSTGGASHAFRETIESIVIAFVLAFLFRTFEAEAFVIPTGSMSPSLQGQHKDVWCSECGYRFQTTASSEGEDRQRRIAQLRNPNLGFGRRQQLQFDVAGDEVLAGMCPMCRQTMAFRTDLPSDIPNYINLEGVERQTSYPGDRILVNKYGYLNEAPLRWDVVVFKFPGNGEMNYIKRLVGLPGETLQVYQGDLFNRPIHTDDEFQILRKPHEKVRVMLQPVHDTDYDSATLFNAGWPLRWNSSGPWQIEADPEEQTVRQRFVFESPEDAADDSVAWLRYQNFTPSERDWGIVRNFQKNGNYGSLTKEEWLGSARPQLIRDFNPYNARRLRKDVFSEGWAMPERHLGMHWVGDLALQIQLEVQQPRGELLLDLVKAGKHFTCRIDLATGQATLAIDGIDRDSAPTSINSANDYDLVFANVDDQLLLWVDDQLIEFADSTYDVTEIFASREDMLPQTSDQDPGDLSPVGVGARDASLKITRLQVLRDIYYVAASSDDNPSIIADYGPQHRRTGIGQLFADPELWSEFSTRQRRMFDVEQNQLFVMGDNSPESLDCRLWLRNGAKGIPGGAYLDRDLLTGKAVCVFWPHSWGSIPGLNKLPGFPNFGDMRIVR